MHNINFGIGRILKFLGCDTVLLGEQLCMSLSWRQAVPEVEVIVDCLTEKTKALWSFAVSLTACHKTWCHHHKYINLRSYIGIIFMFSAACCGLIWLPVQNIHSTVGTSHIAVCQTVHVKHRRYAYQICTIILYTAAISVMQVHSICVFTDSVLNCHRHDT